jgi:hypothetical protein
MVDTIARVLFSWDSMQGRCRATALDAKGNVLGEVVVEIGTRARAAIWVANGPSSRGKVEQIAERHLRSVLELQH